MVPTSADLRLNYRHLYQHVLRAVQFATPQRYVLRDRLRRAFRDGTAADFDQKRINNTLMLLDGAARERGLEHKIVKNLAHVWWLQENQPKSSNRNMKTLSQVEAYSLFRDIGEGFNHTVEMLNDSMGLCIPTQPIFPTKVS